MSTLGQDPKRQPVGATSALPEEADISPRSGSVRFVPEADFGKGVVSIVGPSLQLCLEPARSLEVDLDGPVAEHVRHTRSVVVAERLEFEHEALAVCGPGGASGTRPIGLPWWTRGRVTLLGDAAHPMYPVGSNGASQAMLDARCLADLLAREAPEAALAASEADRLPKTATIVALNRKGGPERVIDFAAERAPNGFSDINTVATHEELANIVSGYAHVAAFDLHEPTKGTP